jgi:hypothetical protein
MKKKNFSISHYFKPTPKRFRILGDALYSASVAVGGYAILNDMKYLALSILVSGWAGKFMTNFFKDDVQNDVQDNVQ